MTYILRRFQPLPQQMFIYFTEFSGNLFVYLLFLVVCYFQINKQQHTTKHNYVHAIKYLEIRATLTLKTVLMPFIINALSNTEKQEVLSFIVCAHKIFICFKLRRWWFEENKKFDSVEGFRGIQDRYKERLLRLTLLVGRSFRCLQIFF